MSSVRAKCSALIAVFVVGLAGCSASVAQSPAPSDSQPEVPVMVSNPVPQLPVTVTSTDGSQVTVTDISRIVSLGGGITETLVSMGLRGDIVGRDVTSDFPGITDVPTVTNAHEVSAEGVLALHPTLVLGDARTGPPEAMQAIRAAKVPVALVPEVWSLAEVAPRVNAIAQVVGMPQAAVAINDHLNSELANIAKPTGNKPVVAFLYVRGTAAVYLIGGKGSGADDMINAAGGIDAGTRAGLEQFTPLTPESLVKAAPDVILVMDEGLQSVGGIDGLLKLPGVAQTPAGQNRRVISVPDGQLLSFGPRTPVTVKRIADELANVWQQ